MKEVKPVRVGERLAAGKTQRKTNQLTRAEKRGASDEEIARKAGKRAKAMSDNEELVKRNDARTARKQGRSDARANAKSKGKGSKPVLKGRKDNTITKGNKNVTKSKKTAATGKVMKDFN